MSRVASLAVAAALAILPAAVAGPDHVDITWMSIANIYYEMGSLNVLTDGYITRVPQSEFYGGRGGLAQTHTPYKPDVEAVTRVLNALGGPSKINILLTGHSHFDHSFDTATWSKLTGARIIGSQTTCFQSAAEGIPAARCTAVFGREKVVLAEGVTMWVVRWNHSGDPATNPEQHNPVELDAIPRVDPSTGGLRAGVAEDFPNGGGNRGFLFSVDGPAGRFSWFYQNSASVTDLHVPIVIDGKDYGAPIENLKAAMTDAGLPSVDLWIGTGGTSVAQLALPILKPKAYLPVHWDGLWGAFQAGVTTPYSDPALETLLSRSGVTLLKPLQYMDKWRLDREGVRPVANAAIKRALGFAGGSAPQAREPAVLGLDHIPVAVADLERAAERYRALGFVLKSGVAHDNGIRNQHAKFADGTEVELITAPEARDALTTTYRQHLAAGDGPAFVAFYAPVMDRVAERLTALKRLFTRDGGYLDLPDTDVLRYIFFGPRNSSPTDRPEHFVHPNTAESLIAVWLAGDDLSQERAALKELGATESYDEVHVPEAVGSVVAHFRESDVIFLPGSHQTVPGRQVIGATLRVASLAAARRVLDRGPWPSLPTVSTLRSTSIFLPPSITHGLWLELREGRYAS